MGELHICRDGGREGGRAQGNQGGSVWVMPSLDVYENFLKGCKRLQAVGSPRGLEPRTQCLLQ